MEAVSEKAYFLITGGTGGIGSEVCRMLPDLGLIPIIGFHNNEQQAYKIATECGGVALKLDLGDEQSIELAIEKITSILGNAGKLVGVVMGASPPPDLMPFAKISSNALHRQLSVNAIGPTLLLGSLIKTFFKKNKKGTVIGILTKALGTDERPPSTGMGAYVIAKSALKSMLLVCSAECSWLKVRTISPGFTETKMLDVFDERYIEMIRNKTSFSSPIDVAKLIIEEIAS